MNVEEIIKSTILGEEHLGENLKRICIEHMNGLKQENQELKKQLESANEQINYLRRSIERKEETIIDLQNERVPYTNEYVDKLLNQQKEFISYLEKIIGELECGDAWDRYKVLVVNKILSKYESIIGGKDEKNTIR